MAKIKYYIRSKNKGQLATVYLRYSDTRGIDFWISTPEKILPEYWSNKMHSFKQRILFNKNFSETKKNEIEKKLNDIEESVKQGITDLKGKSVTKEWLKSAINKIYDKKEPGEETLNQFINRFIEEITSGKKLITKKLNKGNRYNFSTIKNYTGFETQFNEYQGIYTEERLQELKEKKEEPRPRKFSILKI